MPSRSKTAGAIFYGAAFVYLLFAAGHSWGALIQIPRFGLASDAVVGAMQSIKLTEVCRDCTWYGFYRGFGWFDTVYMLFCAWLAWRVARSQGAERQAMVPTAWGLFLCQAATVPIAWMFFFVVPITFSTVLAILLLVGCISLRAGTKL